MIKQILLYPNDKLKQTSEPVESGEDISQLIEDLLDTMDAYRAEGVAAPQIGVNKRVFVFKNKKLEPVVLVNPEIAEQSEETLTAREGCLSFPGVSVSVARAASVTVKATDENGRTVLHSLVGMPAVAAQHELDHLNGVLMLDYVTSRLERRHILKRLKKMKKRYEIQ